MKKTIQPNLQIKVLVKTYLCSDYCPFIDIWKDRCNLFGCKLKLEKFGENLHSKRCKKCLSANEVKE